MTYLSIYAAVSVLVAALPLFAALRWQRLCIAVLLLAAAYVGMTSLPGNAKPARIELLEQVDGAEILWHGGSESEGLHVLLAGPKLYALPWSERTARSLHEATRKAENEGGSFVLRKPQDGTPGGEWSAEHRPAEPGPPKG